MGLRHKSWLFRACGSCRLLILSEGLSASLEPFQVDLSIVQRGVPGGPPQVATVGFVFSIKRPLPIKASKN